MRSLTSLDAAWAAALAANPALQASEANTQASRHLVNSAKANRWPTLSAGAVWARHQPMPKVQTDLTGLTSGLAGLLPAWSLALPLNEQGLAWLPPSLCALLLAALWDRLQGRPQVASVSKSAA